MRIAVLRETEAGDARVAATPETVKKFIVLGATVAVEAGAGNGANIADQLYTDAGATVGDRAATVADADLIVAVQGPAAADLPGLKSGAAIAAILSPFADRARIDGYAAAGVEALAMEFMPRITRAQSMDVLSSQSNLAGYKSVIDAAEAYGRAFPMMMTAAGTISAARVFVMGVGVAGLQAIATARRLGALVSATDVRAATKEQIESLGAKAIFVENIAGQSDAAGGYATETSDEYKAAQAALVSGHIAKQDIVITTALIPGRPAPRLVSDAQLATMRPGSVTGRPCGRERRQRRGLEGPARSSRSTASRSSATSNITSRMAADASALYSRNVYNFVAAFWDKDAGKIVWNARRRDREGRDADPRRGRWCTSGCWRRDDSSQQTFN